MQPILLLPAALLTLALLRWFKRVPSSSLSLPLPPGPKGYPIIGNVFDIPVSLQWKTFFEWSNIYGDVIYLKVPKLRILVLGSAEAAFDLLEKRSEIYSDRPPNIMNELMTSDRWNFGLMRYSSLWRSHRREFHQYFHQHEVQKYRPIQVNECRAFLRRALDNPTHLSQHIRLIYAATILKVTYDMDVTDMNDEYVQLAETAIAGLSEAQVPGKFWVQVLPFLRHIPNWVPGIGFKKHLSHYNPLIFKMIQEPFDAIKQDVAAGQAGKSVSAIMIEKIQAGGFTDEVQAEKEELARNVAGLAYGAAADTTTAAAQSFFIAMSLNPCVQRKAQDELDRVVGPHRLPEFSDHDNLIYIQAVVLESMRWMTVAPIGVPHCVTRDDEYKGYHIPKDTTVLPNIWAMLHNPDDYPEPERFNPDRFIRDGKINPDVRNPLSVAFGFGRRICPGRWLSGASLFMTIASVLHTLDIHPVPEPDGKKFDPFNHAIEGINLTIEKVPCFVTSRAIWAEKLIRA